MKTLLVCGLFLLSANAWAQSFSSSQTDPALASLSASDSGKITKQEYDNFWGYFYAALSATSRAGLIAPLKQQLVTEKECEKELWICAEQAWNSRSVPRCEKGRNKLGLVRANMLGDGNKAQLKVTEDRFDNVLKASARRESLDSTEGPITLEKIKSSQVESDKLLNKLSQVLKVDY